MHTLRKGQRVCSSLGSDPEEALDRPSPDLAYLIYLTSWTAFFVSKYFLQHNQMLRDV